MCKRLFLLHCNGKIYTIAEDKELIKTLYTKAQNKKRGAFTHA